METRLSSGPFLAACISSYKCCTRRAHKHWTPRWLIPDEDHKSEYQQRLKVLYKRHGVTSREIMLIEQEIYLAGFHDLAGNFYCGFCGCFPACFMDAGKSRAFPDLHQFSASVSTRECIGYEKWFEVAARGSVVTIENAVFAIERTYPYLADVRSKASSNVLTIKLDEICRSAYAPPATDEPVFLLGRYEYRLACERGRYWVYARDVEIEDHTLRHGPFTDEAARAFIDKRVTRHEDLKRG